MAKNPNPGRLSVIWTPDPPAPGHTAAMVRHASAVIDHPDPMGLLADAIATALGTEFGGPHQDAETRTLEALCDILHERRTLPSTLDDGD